MSQSASFLNALFAGKPENLRLLLWTLKEKRSRWFTTVPEAIGFAKSVAGDDVYVGVGLSNRDYGANRRCPANEVAGIVGLWADIDLKSDAHKKALPATADEALQILPQEFPPTFVVHTGNGLHAWWLFKEPWIFEGAEERRQAAELSSRWQTLLQYAAQERGWAFDRLADLARVLRIPGTKNWKDPANPKPVTLSTSSELRYNPSEFLAHLNDFSVPSDDEQAQQISQFVGVSENPLRIDLTAAIAEERLAQWIKSDPRFSQTWRKERHDLADSSQSGYDMALASFAVSRGLDDQQVIDLIIHHRRNHGERQPKTVGYFRRTISKARSATASRMPAMGEPLAGPFPAGSAEISGEGTGAAEQVPDPNEKAKICGQISTLFGVNILRIDKLLGAEPVYMMQLENGCIQFPNVGKLLAYRFHRDAFAAKAGKLIPKFPGKQWERISLLLLAACIDKEGTDDLEHDGAARQAIDRYLCESSLTSLDQLTRHDLLQPLVHEGSIAISATGLHAHLARTGSSSVSVKSAAAMISTIGGRAVRLRGGGFKEQSRWLLPRDDWDPDSYLQSHGGFGNVR